jgi:serine/threonine protein kinase
VNRQPVTIAPENLPPLQAGVEALPGYRLLEPLGKGGFGEVWKCEVSGGLQKAIKFVRDVSTNGTCRNAMAQELQSIQWIKGIRHPFLLSIERIEVVAGTLVLVMELADRNLLDLYTSFLKQKAPGIPRPLLLSLLREVAEVLDLMNFQYGLQHLDIKPHNIFLVGTHAKVGDFGLVAGLPGLSNGSTALEVGGITPLYAAPERIRGAVSRTTDQYSLAIVYQQMLTGLTPFRAPTPQLLVQQHQAGTPDLSSLPVEDRPVLTQALARNPEERFPTCSAFVEALVRGERLPGPALDFRPASSGDGPRPLLTPLPGVIPVTPRKQPGSTLPPDATRLVAFDSPTTNPVEFLPGYRLGECLEQTALGDLWRVTSTTGQERLAHWLLHPLDPSPDLIARLEQLRHPALVPTEVHVSPTRRLVLLTDVPRETLRDRLDTCLAEGLPGIPRDRLLHWLFPIAEALDWLASAVKLPHLGVSPACITLDGEWARLRGACLLPLVWLQQGKAAAVLNARYAAPETAQAGGGTSASDQFSLALLYAEMLTGVAPRREAHRGERGERSGGRGSSRLDLDLLPAQDRPVVAQALDDDPECRFPTCSAFLEALVTAGQDPVSLHEFPAVVPVAVLDGTSTTMPAQPEPEPEPGELIETVLSRIVTRAQQYEAGGTPYRVLPDGTWECHYPIQVVPGVLALKLEGFRQQWGGRRMPAPDAETHVLHFIVPMPRTSLFQFRNPEGGIELVVRLLPPGLTGSRSREALIHFRAVGANLPAARKLLQEQGPRLLPSLRTYIHPANEQRNEERHPFPHPLRLWFETSPGAWSPHDALGVDLSRSGFRFRLEPGNLPASEGAEAPHLDLLYVEFVGWEGTAGHAIRARVCRWLEGPDSHEYGAVFE